MATQPRRSLALLPLATLASTRIVTGEINEIRVQPALVLINDPFRNFLALSAPKFLYATNHPDHALPKTVRNVGASGITVEIPGSGQRPLAILRPILWMNTADLAFRRQASVAISVEIPLWILHGLSLGRGWRDLLLGICRCTKIEITIQHLPV